MVYFPSLISYYDQSCPLGTDQTRSPEDSSISSPHSLFSLALFSHSSALQETLSRALRSPLLPFSCSLPLRQQSPFLPQTALIFSALSTSSLRSPLHHSPQSVWSFTPVLSLFFLSCLSPLASLHFKSLLPH